jgi:hypothetical protein
MRKMGSIVLLSLAASLVHGQESIAPAQRGSEMDREHTQWIDSVMRAILTVKPGATRKDLLRVFAEEGGLSTRTHRKYVYKQCPYIKVDVEFIPMGNGGNGSTEMPEDKISTISRPYLEYFIGD